MGGAAEITLSFFGLPCLSKVRLSCEVPSMYLRYCECTVVVGSWLWRGGYGREALPRSVPYEEAFEVDVSGIVDRERNLFVVSVGKQFVGELDVDETWQTRPWKLAGYGLGWHVGYEYDIVIEPLALAVSVNTKTSTSTAEEIEEGLFTRCTLR